MCWCTPEKRTPWCGQGDCVKPKQKESTKEKVNLNDTFDAVIWAEEWFKTIKENPSIPTDRGTMISWFANAIMAGYDHAYREMRQRSK